MIDYFSGRFIPAYQSIGALIPWYFEHALQGALCIGRILYARCYPDPNAEPRTTREMFYGLEYRHAHSAP